MVGGKVEDRLEDHVSLGFLYGDRQRKCFSVDRQRNLQCLEEDLLCYRIPSSRTNKMCSNFSLCPVEDPRNLLAVRIRCVSVVHTYPHMYPRRSTRLETYSDMYVKDEVLLYTMKCKTW